MYGFLGLLKSLEWAGRREYYSGRSVVKVDEHCLCCGATERDGHKKFCILDLCARELDSLNELAIPTFFIFSADRLHELLILMGRGCSRVYGHGEEIYYCPCCGVDEEFVSDAGWVHKRGCRLALWLHYIGTRIRGPRGLVCV